MKAEGKGSTKARRTEKQTKRYRATLTMENETNKDREKEVLLQYDPTKEPRTLRKELRNRRLQ